jgi:hypothetical protein
MTQSRFPLASSRPAKRLSRDRFSILTDFYREEFLKHQRCLEEQREYYSDSAIESVEEALTRIISQVEHLSAKEDADQVVSRLLRKFNVVTRLSSWTDPKNVH